MKKCFCCFPTRSSSPSTKMEAAKEKIDNKPALDTRTDQPTRELPMSPTSAGAATLNNGGTSPNEGTTLNNTLATPVEPPNTAVVAAPKKPKYTRKDLIVSNLSDGQEHVKNDFDDLLPFSIEDCKVVYTYTFPFLDLIVELVRLSLDCYGTMYCRLHSRFLFIHWTI